jgi:hypothetical protein
MGVALIMLFELIELLWEISVNVWIYLTIGKKGLRAEEKQKQKP